MKNTIIVAIVIVVAIIAIGMSGHDQMCMEVAQAGQSMAECQ